MISISSFVRREKMRNGCVRRCSQSQAWRLTSILCAGAIFNNTFDLRTAQRSMFIGSALQFPISTRARNSSPVSFLGLDIDCLELPGLYASKRTDRPKDALHRRAIEDRLRYLVLQGEIEVDEVILSLCMDADIACVPEIEATIPDLSRSTSQPLLQARLLAFAPSESAPLLRANSSLHPAVATLLAMAPDVKSKIWGHPARFAALLAKLSLDLPKSGYRVRPRAGRG